MACKGISKLVFAIKYLKEINFKILKLSSVPAGYRAYLGVNWIIERAGFSTLIIYLEDFSTRLNLIINCK